MGGGLLQKVNRDTYGFAMKCSAISVNGNWRDVYKDPIAGGKTSKMGRLELVEHEGTIKTMTLQEARAWTDKPMQSLLQVVYENGHFRNISALADVRERAQLP